MSYLQRSVNGVTIDHGHDDRLSALLDALSYPPETGECITFCVTHDDGPGFQALGLGGDAILMRIDQGFVAALRRELTETGS